MKLRPTAWIPMWLGLCLAFFMFVVAKLTGHIGWSWWLVTAPIWGPLLIFVIIALAVIIMVGTSKENPFL